MSERQERQLLGTELLRSLLPITLMGRLMLLGVVIWFIDWVFVQGTTLWGSTTLKTLVDLASILAFIPLFYFLFKGARWVTQHLLWRLRRRLIVTYLLIGALPLLLIVSLLALIGWVVVMQSSAGLVERQLDSLLEQSRASALALSRDLSVLGEARPEPELMRRRLQERADVLAPIFPEVTLSVRWYGAEGFSVAVRGATTANGAPPLVNGNVPLPDWLSGQQSFDGLVFTDADEGECKVYARHVIKLTRPAPIIFQLSYPICRSLCAHLTATTDLQVRPGQVSTSLVLTPAGAHVEEVDETTATSGEKRVPWLGALPIFKPITEWRSGRRSERDVLMVDASFLSPGQIWQRTQQFKTGSAFGDVLFWAIAGLAVFFFFIAMLAIGSAVLLTRSITSAVHRLYEGTRRVEAGDFEHEIRITGRDQLSTLSGSFNQMTRSIRELLRVSAAKQRLDQEMKIAAQVQARLFPLHKPPSRRLDFAPGICIPARAVSGDYYDFLAVAPDRIGIVVADVCGKGVSAALMMANLQANLRGQVQAYHDAYNFKLSLAAPVEPVELNALSGHAASARAAELPTYPHPVRRIVQRVNQQVAASMMDASFITFFYAEFDEQRATLRYTNAGHNPPLLYRAQPRNGPRIERLECGGTVLGLFSDAEYEDAELKLESGDVLAAFTDGLIEASNGHEEEFGEQRLIQVLTQHAHESAAAIEGHILQAVRAWTSDAEQADDLTLIIFKVH
jgi:phosphoserine phosphatase RsbU/P